MDTISTVDIFAELLRKMMALPDGTQPGQIAALIYRNHDALLTPIIRRRILEAEALGLVRACPNPGKHRLRPVAQWDQGVARGFETLADHEFTAIAWSFCAHLSEVARHWQFDPTGAARRARPTVPVSVASIIEGVDRVEIMTEDRVMELARLLEEALRDPRTPLHETPDVTIRSAADNRVIQVMWVGWQPVVATKARGGPLTPLAETPALPPIRHYELPTNGRLLAFSSRDTIKALQETLHHASVKTVGLGDGFSSDLGVNRHSCAVFAATGLLEIHLGDHFPHLVADGNLLRGTTAGSDEELPVDMDVLTRGALDNPVFGTYEAVAAMIASHESVENLAEAERLLDAAIAAFEIVVIHSDRPKTMHLYVPDGWRARDFDLAVSGSGLLTDLPDEETYLLLAGDPIDLPEGMVADAPLA